MARALQFLNDQRHSATVDLDRAGRIPNRNHHQARPPLRAIRNASAIARGEPDILADDVRSLNRRGALEPCDGVRGFRRRGRRKLAPTSRYPIRRRDVGGHHDSRARGLRESDREHPERPQPRTATSCRARSSRSSRNNRIPKRSLQRRDLRRRFERSGSNHRFSERRTYRGNARHRVTPGCAALANGARPGPH